VLPISMPSSRRTEKAPPSRRRNNHAGGGLQQALGGKVKDVRVSKRLTDSAVCLVADGLMDRTLERLLSRQQDSGVSMSAPVLEVNAGHGLIKALAAQVEAKGPAPWPMRRICCWTRRRCWRVSPWPTLPPSPGAWPR
jgi:HSP90 family molecular chaperone